MSEKGASSAEHVTVYVRLLDEGTEVSRPTLALEIAPGVFELLPTEEYDPEDEHWEFPPGSRVHVEWNGDYLLAAKGAN